MFKEIIANITCRTLDGKGWQVASSRVNLDVKHDIHPGSIIYAWNNAFGQTLMEITSANDSTHSRGSVHPNGEAIDIRIWNFSHVTEVRTHMWWGALENACLAFAEVLGPRFSLVLEKDHIHLQLTKKNIRTPDSGLGRYSNVWITRKGRVVE